MTWHQPVEYRLRLLVLASVAGLVAALLGLPPVTPAAADTTGPKAAGPPVPHLSWVDCNDGFQCATADVPLDYDHPQGTKISLAVLRLPASDPAHKIGSIFLNPGGPGGSGVEFARLGPELFSPAVRARFDLVGFDPRGIAESTPLRCFTTFDEALATLAPFAFPVTKPEELIQFALDQRLSAACRRHGGPILDHMATADVARDMDLLRQAVGDRQLTYYGVSYGSYLGTTYADLFPDKVRALVVDGVLDPVAWSTGRDHQARKLPFSTRLHSEAGADATLQQFFRLCDRGGSNCAFSGGDPADRYRRLAQRLLANAAQLPDGLGGTTPLTYADLVSITLGALYDPGAWPDLAILLQDLDTLANAPATTASLHALRVRLGAAQEPYPNFVEGFPGVACSDSDNPEHAEAWPRSAADADRAHPYFGRPWTWISSPCQAWPGRDTDRYTGPFTKATAHPVLVIGNRYDPATRYQGAVTVAHLLPRSRLLTLAGWGHTSLFKSACIDAHLNSYLLTTQVPPRGTVCPADTVPFAAPAATPVPLAQAAAAAVIPPVIRQAMSR